jgi:hypothetical protein
LAGAIDAPEAPPAEAGGLATLFATEDARRHIDAGRGLTPQVIQHVLRRNPRRDGDVDGEGGDFKKAAAAQ